MPFEFEKTDIEGLLIIKSKIFDDQRGFFLENYKKSDFVNNGITDEFLQENYSISKSKVLRGLHYQVKPFAQAKLIRCLRGRVIDIAVDLRPKSKTFKKYYKTELSDRNHLAIYIPDGFAHGFVALEDNTQLSYKTTKEYAPESERGIIWNDKELDVDWGIDFEPILSDKDLKLPNFDIINKDEL